MLGARLRRKISVNSAQPQGCIRLSIWAYLFYVMPLIQNAKGAEA